MKINAINPRTGRRDWFHFWGMLSIWVALPITVWTLVYFVAKDLAANWGM